MCVGYWSLDHADYSLILCANRDEYLSRPTAPAHFHAFGPVSAQSTPSENHSVLSGRDMVAGGTWLGMTRSERVGLLTNITEPYSTYATSRGHLLQDFMLSQSGDGNALPLALESLEARNSEPYAGFNMLLLEPTISPGLGLINYIAAYVTNHGAGGVITSRPLAPAECRCGGLSNGIDGRGADAWPKVQLGIEGFHRTIFQKTGEKMDEGDLVEGLFELLRWKSAKPPEERSELRNTILIDPIRLAPKPGATSTVPEYYGTRLSTVILVSRKTGTATFIERDMWRLDAEHQPVMGEPSEQRTFHFEIEAKT